MNLKYHKQMMEGVFVVKFPKSIASLVAVVFILGLFVSGCGGGAKQEAKPQVQYPTKPVQLVVPAGAGGDTDTNARILGKYLEKELGKPVVVVNAGGAGGTAGTKKVKDAPADGYTVLFHHPSFPLHKIMGLTDFSFDDLAVANVTLLDNTNVFAVSAESKFKTMKDVVEHSKANPKSVKFATEVGNFTHIHVLAVEAKTGIKMNVVDVGSAAAKTAALMGNQIDIIGTQYGLIKQYIDAGKFRVLGVLSDKRHPQMPNVPTFKEQGIDVSFSKYFFCAFPKGTPKEIIEKFNAAVQKVGNNPEYKAEMAKFMVTPSFMPPAQALEYLKKDEVVLKTLVEKAGFAGAAKKK